MAGQSKPAGQSSLTQSAFHPCIRYQTLVVVNETSIITGKQKMQSAILTLLITILVLALVVDPKSGHSVVHITASSPTTTITVLCLSDSIFRPFIPYLDLFSDAAIATSQVPLDQVVDIKLKTCVECGNEWLLQTSPNATRFKVR